MIATTSDNLVTLRERRRQLADRLEELRSGDQALAEDVTAAQTDWADAVALGEDVGLLAERVRLRQREAADAQAAAAHLAHLLAGVDAQISDIEARERLVAEAAAYAVELDVYRQTLPGLPGALPDAVEVVSAALDALLGEIDGARSSYGQLLATAAGLRQRAGMLSVEIHAPDPADWSAGLNRVDKNGLYWQLALAVMQQRGAQAVLSEVARVILLNLTNQQRAAR
jgi:uncharacterized protein (UPF0335 family)